MTEDEMVRWHHRLDGHEFEQAPRAGDGQGGLACCSPRGHKESVMTELLNRLTTFFGVCCVLSHLPHTSSYVSLFFGFLICSFPVSRGALSM